MAEYFQAQADLVNAMMLYRGRQRELSGLLLRFSDLASREEVEDVGRTMHALRRQVRSLRRDLDALTRATTANGSGRRPIAAGARRPREGADV